MKYSLNEEAKSRLEEAVAGVEKRTGSQIVLAVIERCDAYPEIPWKAFAMGCSIASVFALNLSMVYGFTLPESAVLLAIVMILSAGAGLAVLSMLFPNFARLFLQKNRAQTETLQYAESLFLSRGMVSTGSRRAVLLLIGLFERHIVILPDTGLAQNITTTERETIIENMRPLLRSGKVYEALETGLKDLEQVIQGGPTPCDPVNELPNGVIQEKGV